jgi:hypothetical protein
MIRYFILLIVLLRLEVLAQIPVEAFFGNERTTADVLWFRYIKNAEDQSSKFLFFNRSRASVDYSNQTAFGLTNAVSYNFKSGLGLVAVAQFFGNGLFPKAGIQYYTRKKNWTLFTWIVSETWSKPSFDWFVLSRFEPALSENLKLFTQLETLSITDNQGQYQFTQRVRIGIGFKHAWQVGFGGDFQQIKSESRLQTHNLGLFLRKEF